MKTRLVQMPLTVGKSALLYVLQEIPLNLLENAYIQCTGFKVTQHKNAFASSCYCCLYRGRTGRLQTIPHGPIAPGLGDHWKSVVMETADKSSHL